MDLAKLKELFKIKPADAPAGPDPFDTQETSPNTPSETTEGEPSRQVVRPQDAWEAAQGDKILRHNKDARATGADAEAVTDFFNLAFQATPTIEEKVTDDRRKEFVTTTQDTPDFRALHRDTETNPLASELCAIELASGWGKLAKKDEERKRHEEDMRRKGRPVDPERSKRRAEMDCLRFAGKAVKEAGKKVEEVDSMLTALGMGPGAGNSQPLNLTKVVGIYERVKNSQRLRNIFDKAGRYISCAQAKQRVKVHHGYEDMVGVRLDDSLDRLLDEEVVALVDPELELDGMRRLLEREMLALEYRGTEPQGKGPIVCCVDESGSMTGTPIEEAKAFALSLAWVARYQKRWLVLCGYSGGTEGTKLVLPPNRWDEGALLDWLAHQFGGGTECDIPYEKLPHEWWPEFVAQGMPRGRTDLIVITDGVVHVPPDLERRFNEWKQREKCRAIGILINARNAGGMERTLDEVHLSRGISLQDDGVQQSLSL